MGLRNVIEYVVGKPMLATAVVGTSILAMQWIVAALESSFQEISYLAYIIPFIPPYFITKTAKRIKARQAEYHFVRDADPLIFVGFPKELTIDSLLSTVPEIVSDSASRHFGVPSNELEEKSVFHQSYFENQGVFTSICEALLLEVVKNPQRAVLPSTLINIPNRETGKSRKFVMNSILVKVGDRYRWQATLIILPNQN